MKDISEVIPALPLPLLPTSIRDLQTPLAGSAEDQQVEPIRPLRTASRAKESRQCLHHVRVAGGQAVVTGVSAIRPGQRNESEA
ncbi:hypothetical protein E2C01_061911 [Portunus trituberculatus]|uniref:Uncharacterized protein n=1 Tax=Portunus trituberculatus TaxID=210409 RepID=A0A5B7HFP0_PORTR|nr:hypothetical protein [Portunus trituberculatus]